MDPLTALNDAIESEREIPRGWAEAHAPDGDLRALWERCADPAAMIMLAVVASEDLVPVTLAACACARLSRS